jgi:hypothetical protein
MCKVEYKNHVQGENQDGLMNEVCVVIWLVQMLWGH